MSTSRRQMLILGVVALVSGVINVMTAMYWGGGTGTVVVGVTGIAAGGLGLGAWAWESD